MSKNVLVIDGHPDPDPARFVHALSESYAAGAANGGHQVKLVVVAGIDFPLLRSRVAWESDRPTPAIQHVQEMIKWADHLAIFYPLWLGDMPALLKGLLEQIMRPGFAIAEGTRPKPLLTGRSARLIVTMGMPTFFYRFYFGAHSVKSFERNILKFVGIKSVHHSLIGSVDGSADARQKWLDTMTTLGAAAE